MDNEKWLREKYVRRTAAFHYLCGKFTYWHLLMLVMIYEFGSNKWNLYNRQLLRYKIQFFHFSSAVVLSFFHVLFWTFFLRIFILQMLRSQVTNFSSLKNFSLCTILWFGGLNLWLNIRILHLVGHIFFDKQCLLCLRSDTTRKGPFIPDLLHFSISLLGFIIYIT